MMQSLGGHWKDVQAACIELTLPGHSLSGCTTVATTLRLQMILQHIQESTELGWIYLYLIDTIHTPPVW